MQILGFCSGLNFPASGLISLPPTPQGSQERTQFTISCPDGLAHGLSEQNIRLHQIVQEHKVINLHYLHINRFIITMNYLRI